MQHHEEKNVVHILKKTCFRAVFFFVHPNNDFIKTVTSHKGGDLNRWA